MFQIIEKIAAILNGYGDGKLIAGRKASKRAAKERVRDVVSISAEARQRSNSGGTATGPAGADEAYGKQTGREPTC